MTSDRQIGANRLNAMKSSGPRTSAGRRKASGNSYRHGLAVSRFSTTEQAWHVEQLAREIGGNTVDPFVLEHARAAAQAEFDLAQVRRVKVATINQVLAIGRVDGIQQSDDIAICQTTSSGREITADEAVLPLPSLEPERTAEAVRRALPELIKLDRYEHKAVRRREQAMRAIYAAHHFYL